MAADQRRNAEVSKLIRGALTLVTSAAEQGEATGEDLVAECGRPAQQVQSELRWALDTGLLDVLQTLEDGSQILQVTRHGWEMVLLRWIARHGVASVEDLMMRFGLSEQEVEAGLLSTLDEGLLRVTGTLRAEPELFVATAKGLKEVGLRYLRVCQASSREEGHLRTNAQAAVALELEYGEEYVLGSEREATAMNRGKGSRFIGSPLVMYRRSHEKKQSRRKRPDMLLMPKPGVTKLPIAIEVELSQKAPEEMKAICLAWRNCQSVEKVIYMTAPEITSRVRAAIVEAQAQEKVFIEELNPVDVPQYRRKQYYKPEAIPGSRDRYLQVFSGPTKNAHRELWLQILGVVAWIAWQGVVDVETLAMRFALSESDMCELLVLAHGAGLVNYSTMLRSEGAFFWITRRGLKMTRLDGQVQLIDHQVVSFYNAAGSMIVCARVAALVHRGYPEYKVKSRQELSADQAVTGLPLLSVGEPYTGLGNHRHPDLLLVRDDESDELPIAVVIEPYTLDSAKTKRILDAWAKSEDVAMTVFYATDPAVVRAGRKIVDELGVADRITVELLAPYVPLELRGVRDSPREQTRAEPEVSAYVDAQSMHADLQAIAVDEPREPFHLPVIRWTPDALSERQSFRADHDFHELSNETWKALVAAVPQLKRCEKKGRQVTCDRLALNGVLYGFSKTVRWEGFSTALCYGTRGTCERRLASWRGSGTWDRIEQMLRQLEPWRFVERAPSVSPGRFELPVLVCDGGREKSLGESLCEQPFMGLKDDTWQTLVREIDGLKECDGRYPGRICNRMVLNGIFTVLSTDCIWSGLPTELGYGSSSYCKKVLGEWQADGIWGQIAQRVAVLEPDRQVDWDYAIKGVRRSRRCAGRTIERFPKVSDELWAIVGPRLEEIASARRPRTAVTDRAVLDGTLCILLNEISWKALDTSSGYGDHAGRRQRLRKWLAAGAWWEVREELTRHSPYDEISHEQWMRVSDQSPHAHDPWRERKISLT